MRTLLFGLHTYALSQALAAAGYAVWSLEYRRSDDEGRARDAVSILAELMTEKIYQQVKYARVHKVT